MFKTIRKYIKSKTEREQALAEYIRTGTAVGLAGAGIGLYLVLWELASRRRRAEEREKEIDDLAGEVGEIGDLLVGLKLVDPDDVAEIGTLDALKKAIETRQKG
jgi:hypothetical protein